MKILSFPSFTQKTKLPQLNKLNYFYPQDTVSFSAMKKSAFSGIDLACVNLFKIPIEKFNTMDDYNDYVSDKLLKLYSEIFMTDNYEVFEAREDYLRSWKWTLKNPPFDSQPALALIIYSSITKDLGMHDKNMPPLFIEKVFLKTIEDMKKRFEENAKSGYDFSRNYDFNAKRFLDIPKNGWLYLPSVCNDEKNSYSNFQKLKVASLNTWCTKNNKAEEYIYKHDFHIYRENDKTILALKVNGSNIIEMQGAQNNSKIPINYVDIVKSYVEENSLHDTSSILKNSIADKQQRDKFLSELSNEIATFDRKAIFDYFGISMLENEDGTITLSSYSQPSRSITFNDLGIDETKLFAGVTKIEKDANFSNSSLTDLGELKEIGGHCSFLNSLFQTTGKLEKVGSICASSHNLKEITNLKLINGNADFSSSSIKSLGSIEIINGDLFLKKTEIQDLGALKSVFGDFYGWKECFKRNPMLVVQGNLN